MANEYLRLQDTQMNIEKAQNLLAVIETKRKNKPELIQNENNMFKELWKAFKDFFSRLGKPTIQLRYLKETAPPISDNWNSTMSEITNDMGVAYTEVGSLGSLLVKNFNYGESDRQLLLNSVRKLNSKTIDYSFYAKGQKDQSLYGIDNFTDSSKIDATKVGAGSHLAEIVTGQGVITLKRTGNVGRDSLVTKITGVQESIPAWNPIEQTGGYEGLYFGMQGEARPEGGLWHLEYTPNGTTLFEKGASEAELMPKRLEMVDGNPDTFWEVEFNIDNLTGYQNKYSGEQISVSAFDELRSNEVDSPNVNIQGDTIVTGEYGSLIEDYIPVTQAGPVDFLKVDFIMHLSRSVLINWLNLNPNNFGTSNYMDILSIETSEDGQSFERLEGFDDHEYDIALTSEANEELTPGQLLDTLSPDKFKFTGQGIWTFAPRKVRMIKFSLRQSQSYIKPYEVLKYETNQVSTTTTKKKSWIWGKEKTTVDESTAIREYEVPYLEGMINGLDVMGLEGSSEVNEDKGWGDSIQGIVGWVLTGGFGGFGGTKEIQTKVGAENITRQWRETKHDKARLAMGIRDVGIFSYNFAEVSEIVSKPFTSPKPISKVSLTVDEFIPKIFYTNEPGSENEWIKYHISVDDGVSWNRISPMNHNSTPSGDGINNIPEVININSDISSDDRGNPLSYVDAPEPIYNVRFKAVLSRPADLNESESYTPILNKYALKIYPFGGL